MRLISSLGLGRHHTRILCCCLVAPLIWSSMVEAARTLPHRSQLVLGKETVSNDGRVQIVAVGTLVAVRHVVTRLDCRSSSAVGSRLQESFTKTTRMWCML